MHTRGVFAPCALALVIALGFLVSPSEARVVRLEITSRESFADGMPFGHSGPYEKLRGTAFFEVDPRDHRNAVVFDLDKAPRNSRGMVEFSADMFILKPVDMKRGNRGLFFEVNNRGNKITLAQLNDTPPTANGNNPTTTADVGNGFLMREGYVIAWVGWGADIAPGGDRLTVQFPIAMENGQPITELILTGFSDRNFGGGTPFTLPLSGGPAFKSYEAVSTDKTVAMAELRMRPSDSPRPSAPDIPAGVLVPASQWSFANCPTGPPGTPSTTDICLEGGFQNNMVYELVYKATKSPVMGLGYVTSRDFVSFLRYGGKGDDEGEDDHRTADDHKAHKHRDEAENRSPVRGIKTVLCQGISSSGMYYRDYLYQGFNEDEEGRRVCDGVNIHIPGVQKLFLNYRFAQPNPFTVQHRERYVPDTNFPRSYAVRRDPLTGIRDGILKRCQETDTCPKIMHTDSSTEWWQFRASLVDTDEDGTRDLRQPDNVRRYLYSSTQHFPRKGATPTFGTGNRQCQQLSNMTHPGIIARALITALDEWVRHGERPPHSRVPRIADATLVETDQASTGFPNIPGVNYNGLYNGSGERDFGPRVHGNAGVIDKLLPTVMSVHRVLVPKVDAFGIDVAGIRHPYVEAPIATLTGWNLRRAEFTDGDLCDLTGMTVPLHGTRAERLSAGDPRKSLEELYGDHEGYVKAIKEAAKALRKAGFLLKEDAEQIIEEAEASDVLK
jgi:Alpha/beta hydrolase domain